MEIVELGMLGARTRNGWWLAAADAHATPAARGARAVPWDGWAGGGKRARDAELR